MPTAVVTGANRGLGLETAQQLARRGYRVWLTGRDAAAAEHAASGLRAQGLEVPSAELDVASEQSIAAFAARTADEPPIDALVNNAGASLEGFDARIAAQTLEGNYRGPARLTDALLTRLSPSANIVMVSSGMGELSRFSAPLRVRLLSASLTRADIEQLATEFVSAVARDAHHTVGFPGNAYSVSKALMNAFTRVLSHELAGTGRHVNAVCPGWVRTRMGGSGAPRSLEQGASGIVWAATLPASGPKGGFFRDEKPIAW